MDKYEQYIMKDFRCIRFPIDSYEVTKMASLNLLVQLYLLPLLATSFVTSFALDASNLIPFNCSAQINSCKASLIPHKPQSYG